MKILTFDIEDWVIYKRYALGPEKQINNILDGILDILDQQNLKATFFCMGLLAREYPYVIRKIAERKHQIGCHSDLHQWLTDFTPEQLNKDTQVAIDSIEQVIGTKVKCYRAPAYTITPLNQWAFEVLYDNGIEFDSSIFPSRRDYGGWPDFPKQEPLIVEYAGKQIKEFPIVTTPILGKEIAYSGGGYFRLMPYCILSHLFSKQNYVMTYFHPRDFDKAQKRYWTKRYIKDYYGTKSAFSKFKKIIKQFEYIDLDTADKKIDWTQVPILKLEF